MSRALLSNSQRVANLPSSETVETLLRELVMEIRGLRADLLANSAHVHNLPMSSLSRADRAQLERLLPTIVGAMGSELFLVREVLAHPSAALRLVCGGTNGKALGRLLKRAQGIPIAGYVVACDGEEVGAALWRVRQIIP